MFVYIFLSTYQVSFLYSFDEKGAATGSIGLETLKQREVSRGSRSRRGSGGLRRPRCAAPSGKEVANEKKGTEFVREFVMPSCNSYSRLLSIEFSRFYLTLQPKFSLA